MKAFIVVLLAVTACSADVVQVLPPLADAGSSQDVDGGMVDAGPPDAGTRDSGPKTFECPTELVVRSRHVLSDVEPTLPARVVINSSTIFAVHGQRSGTDVGVGTVAIDRRSGAASFGISSLEGAIRTGPFLSAVRDDGFLIAMTIDDGTTYAQTDAFIADSAPTRTTFSFNDRFRIQDMVAQRDDLILTGTSTGGDIFIGLVRYDGTPVGFGLREATLVQPIKIAKFAALSRAPWLFTVEPDILPPNIETVVASQFSLNGTIRSFSPTVPCGPVVDFDVAAVDDNRAFTFKDCRGDSVLTATSFAVGETGRSWGYLGRIRAHSRVGYDGTTAYALRWPILSTLPRLRHFDRSGGEIGLVIEVPITDPESIGESMDIGVHRDDDDVATVAVIVTYRDATGELIVFEGCGLR